MSEELELRLFENRVLRKIFEPQRHEVRGEFYGPNCLLNAIRLIKSGRMRWAGHVARVEWEKRCIKVFGGEM